MSGAYGSNGSVRILTFVVITQGEPDLPEQLHAKKVDPSEKPFLGFSLPTIHSNSVRIRKNGHFTKEEFSKGILPLGLRCFFGVTYS